MNKEGVQPIIGIVLCVLFFLGYQQYMSKKYPRQPTDPIVMETLPPGAFPAPGSGTPEGTAGHGAAVGAAVGAGADIAAQPQVRKLGEKELTLENADMTMRFDQERGAIASVLLKHYKRARDSDDPVELLDSPFTLRGVAAPDRRPSPIPGNGERVGNVLRFTHQVADWKIVESVKLEDSGYDLKIDVAYTNTAAAAQELSAGIWYGSNVILPSSSGSFIPRGQVRPPRLVAGIDQSLKTADAKAACGDAGKEPAIVQNSEKVRFAGIDLHYFLAVVRPSFEKVDLRAVAEPGRGTGLCPLVFTLTQRMGSVAAGETVNLQFASFFGPKDLTILEERDALLT